MNIVAGREVAANSGRTFEKSRPVDGSFLCAPPRSDAADVAAAVAAARAAQPVWAATTAVERGRLVRELTLALQARREEAAAIVVEETGKPLELALGETDAAIEMGFFVAGEGRRLYGRTTTVRDAATAPSWRCGGPSGSPGLIVSFNTPLPNYAWKAFPGGALRQHGRPEAVGAHTGLGRVLRPSCAASCCRRACSTSCRGSAPRRGRRSSSTPTSTSSASRARRRPVAGSPSAAGAGWRRSCSSSAARTRSSSATTPTSTAPSSGRSRRRSPMRASVAPRRAASSCSTRSTTSSANGSWQERARYEPGPVISEASLERILGALGRREGARSAASASIGRAGGSRRRWSRTCAADAELSCTELFGPVAILYRVGGLEEAIALVNDSPYGLTSAIHTASLHRAMRFADEVRSRGRRRERRHARQRAAHGLRRREAVGDRLAGSRRRGARRLHGVEVRQPDRRSGRDMSSPLWKPRHTSVTVSDTRPWVLET